jgi:GT2 family glycosyltransferase
VEHFVDGRPPPWRNVQGARERPPSGAFEPLIGCNMGISRELLFQVGGFDDTSPLGWEDIDLSIRATSRGISIGWAEHAIVLRRRPSSARSLWQKEFAYGRGWTMLERRYPQLSSDGRVTPMLRRAGWLAIRVPYVMHPARRNGWVGRAAALSGRLTERVHASA